MNPAEKDTQSRKWQLTINNPDERGLTHESIKNRFIDLKALVYWCMCDEIGENGTYHTHLYMAFSGAVRFSTIKKYFEGAHFEMANGTSQQNRDYIRKEGKWAKDKKKETNLPDTFEEYGEMPIERQGSRNDLHDLYDMIRQGMTNFDIIDQCPEYMMNIDKIERCRQIVREEQNKNTWRDIEVTYIFGRSGAGKTRGVMEEYGYENVYRVTDYIHPFDAYKGQDVMLFDEFRSSLRIQDMLVYLEGYPLQLPCRYTNKIACFTKVFIISNLDLTEQYTTMQSEHKETWQAFVRRINKVKVYTGFLAEEYRTVDYFTQEHVLPDNIYIPF